MCCDDLHPLESHPVTTTETNPHFSGYGRVSTRDQNPGSQEAALRAAGCDRVFIDHGESSRIAERPQWAECRKQLRRGDTLVILALDRIAGSELMAIEIIRDLGNRGVRLKSLTEPFLDVDTSTPMGEAIVGIMAVLAQLRVSTIRANTLRGIEHARAQGKHLGRPRAMTAEQIDIAVESRQLTKSGHPKKSYQQIADLFGVSRHTVMRAVREREEHG